MKHSRNLLFFTVGLALALVLAACGSSNGSGPYGVGSSGGQTPSSSSGCGRYCSHPSSPTTGSALVIKTATMTVHQRAGK